MDVISCTQCNKQLIQNDKFCPHCGTPVVSNSSEKKVTILCSKCNHENQERAAFCEKCGASIATTGSAKNEKSEFRTFSSSGNYSGKMIKGKTSKSWKVLLYVILTIVAIGAIALIIWFQRDPDAGEKLKNIAGGILVAAIFIFFVFRGNKKGRARRGGRYEFEQGINDDNDYDDDSSDDGGDDDD